MFHPYTILNIYVELWVKWSYRCKLMQCKAMLCFQDAVSCGQRWPLVRVCTSRSGPARTEARFCSARTGPVQKPHKSLINQCLVRVKRNRTGVRSTCTGSHGLASSWVTVPVTSCTILVQTRVRPGSLILRAGSVSNRQCFACPTRVWPGPNPTAAEVASSSCGNYCAEYNDRKSGTSLFTYD